MLIIFEGPDNVGKTTQISLLRNYLAKKNIPTIITHSSAYKNISNEKHKEYANYEYSSIFEIGKKYNIIADRLHLGEPVYGTKYRKYDGNYVFNLEKSIENRDDIFLFVFIDNPKNLIKREDGLSFSNKLNDKIEEIESFKRAFKLSNIKNKKLINIENTQIEEVQNEILDFIKDKI